MSRLFRLSFLVVLLSIIAVTVGYSQQQSYVFVSGRIAPGDVRIFVKDSVYVIDRNYVVGGTLLIEPGTTVYFYPNGRIIDSVGGRIIADGYAQANYSSNPNGLDPIGIPGSPSNPNYYSGYGDLRYFLHAGVVNTTTTKDPTVHPTKYNHIFNVVVDTVARKVKNLILDATTNAPVLGPNDVIISPEAALMYQAARLYTDPNSDIIIKTRPWSRIGGRTVNITNGQIKFIGQPTDNFSREWGHFVILPGARAAFFRNVLFDGFRKDTTVDRQNFYAAASQPGLSDAQIAALNNSLIKESNGAGGVITSFSSRLWLIEATFKNNMSRYRGGALNILQAPDGYASGVLPSALSHYDASKNPNITEKDGNLSYINQRNKPWSTLNNLYLIDAIDEPTAEPFLADFDRQKYDDGRVALFLARVRNLKFEGNYVQLTNVKKKVVGVNPPIEIITDDIETPASAQPNGNNMAYGGAIYISGNSADDYRNLDLGLGVNNSYKRMSDNTIISFPKYDTFEATNNSASNYQNALVGTNGARGGVIFINNKTSLRIAGKLNNNRTYTKFLQDDNQGLNNGTWSQGGAIFFNNSDGRLQVVGGPLREPINTINTGNMTEFIKNSSGSGGAIFVNSGAGSQKAEFYTVIGGSDVTATTRDYGYNIRFEDNSAFTAGGAIYSKRNIIINGAGGVVANGYIGYTDKYSIRFKNNTANFAGGALCIDAKSDTRKDRLVRIVRTIFEDNRVGEVITNSNIQYIVGGGAIYSSEGDLNEVRAVEFLKNKVYNGNGGAIALSFLTTDNMNKRFFVSDVDQLVYNNEIAESYSSTNEAFTYGNAGYPADVRMLTRFLDNEVICDSTSIANLSGNGSVQITPNSIGSNNTIILANTGAKKAHRLYSTNSTYGDMPENGIGLGGGMYVIVNRVKRPSPTTMTLHDGVIDTTFFNRVRIQNNKAYTGSAIYSDNYDSKLIFSRSLVVGNNSYSKIGLAQNYISGPLHLDTQYDDYNYASSDLAPATIYGEVQGPIPSYTAAIAGNSMYGNNARFLIRLPDAPSTKGVLAGTKGVGYGGTDTLRGNYWGLTEANVNVRVDIRKIKFIDFSKNPPDTLWYNAPEQETFFIARDFDLDKTYMKFMRTPNNPLEQGPFESTEKYSYTPIPLNNLLIGNNKFDQNQPGVNSIPEKALFSGIVYDVHDKGTDIKTADYTKRRMSPIEDFAVGIPPVIKRYSEDSYNKLPSYNKYVRRWIRDPYIADSMINGSKVYPWLSTLQDEYRPNSKGEYYHPMGHPIYLETRANYNVGDVNLTNHDERMLNETVFYIINENTGDFITSTLKQVAETAPYREVFRARVDLVPDQTLRDANTSLRRNAEGLYNYGTGYQLLEKLRDGDPYSISKLNGAQIEQGAVLQGRKYSAAATVAGGSLLGNITNLYSNRPELPDSNNGVVTYFAGERYRTLPANEGDLIRIVSRTVLYREGVQKAYDDGISFKVVKSTEPPVFTGNIVKMQTDTMIKIVPSKYPAKKDAGIYDTLKITEFLNKIFLREDRKYPASYPDGRTTIMTVTAMDTNKFFDPRALANPNGYAYLLYKWNVDVNSGLERWLDADTIYAAPKSGFQNPKDNARGYLSFKGLPLNPFVVPGGEDVNVSAENFPPFVYTVDALKEYRDPNTGLPMPQDTIDKFISIYGKYLNAMAYDQANARYLQQDTINAGTNNKASYTYKIFVTDSLPRILESAESVDWKYRGQDLTLNYLASEYRCGKTNDGKLKANLTLNSNNPEENKLRFQADINTDDEQEDAYALVLDAMFNRNPWDFRYGKTAYSFMTTHLRADDTTVVDTTIYDKEMLGADIDSVVSQTRPVWMANKYIYRYDREGTNDQDKFGVDFQSKGQLNVRIASDEAMNLLKPNPQYNGALNLDTLFSLVVTDGHGGLTTKEYPIFINVSPTITTTSLPAAKEDYDYNPQLLDSNRMIKVFDPNFGQDHRFELVYSDYPMDTLWFDPCYREAGYVDLAPLKTTPKWLKINPVSGLLYGTPSVEDAPKQEKVTVIVWDRIDDQNELAAIKTFDLTVDSTNHAPRLLTAPISKCVDKDMPYNDTLFVTDRDLQRITQPYEKLTLTVLEPSGLRIEPSTVEGKKDESQLPIKVIIKGDKFSGTIGTDGRVTIKVRVTDASGMSHEITYKVKLSEETNFVVPVKVENAKGAYQLLEFGTAKLSYGPTTGDGGTTADDYVGKLDSNFCEFELPPYPHTDIFDARWTIPTKNGILRNIFPEATSKTTKGEFVYRAKIQSGGEAGNTANHYPVKITWDMTLVPDRNDQQRNAAGSTWWIRDAVSNGNVFNYNMRTGNGWSSPDIKKDVQGNNMTLTIMRDVIDAFVIVYDWITPVDEPVAPEFATGIASITPNPVSKATQINFAVNTANRIKIDIYNSLGNVVATVTDADYSMGYYTLVWTAKDMNGNDLPNGAYTVRMTAGGNTSTYQMVIVK